MQFAVINWISEPQIDLLSENLMVFGYKITPDKLSGGEIKNSLT